MDLWWSWRFYLCLGISILLAFSIHGKFGSDPWVFFLSVPCVLAGLLAGFVWQARSES